MRRATFSSSHFGVDVKLINVNPETGEGEIVVKGDNVMQCWMCSAPI